MALLTIAEWVGSAVIGNLVDKVSSYMGDCKLPADFEAELNRLNAALPKIATVMTVAEALKLNNPDSRVKAWIHQFKLAFQAAEDVLDELKYKELENMVQDRDRVGGFFSSILGSRKRKSSDSNIDSDTLGRLQEAVRLLDQASKDVGDFYQVADGLHFSKVGKVSSQETTSFLTESKVIGRETEKTMIIEWLKKPVPHAHTSGFCIVGAGGLGKTTLAQLISEEMSKEKIFDKTIWVCVSTNFSVVDITRKILQELGESSHGGESLNVLQKRLKENVCSKKVLFILDDVWNEDEMHEWEKLVAPLKSVQEGSKILLTTRMKSVADMFSRVLNVEREYLYLRGLEEQQLLLLLLKYAFYGYNPDNHKDLQKIGNEIVTKLWGSPLAAKVIGSLLNSNMDSRYWERILKCNSLINLEQAKEVADVLKLSYYYLSADLQQCFRFCSIFPQDFIFEKNELIRMWMASGFIRQQSCREEKPEDIGEEYFNNLLKKSFFELAGEHNRGKCYVLHDMMHELAQNVSEGECFRVDKNTKAIDIPSIVQHVCVPDREIESVFHLKNLRTLVIIMLARYKRPGYEVRFVVPNGSLKKNLRVLFITGEGDGDCSYELPNEIDCLMHLRFLRACAESGSLISNPICKLYHLQTMELSGVEMIGSTNLISITNLISLRYLKLPDKIMENVHGVHKLTSLQELTIHVGRDSGRHIDELKALNNLQHLCIKKIENVGDPAQAKNANLSQKESLLSLSLNWTKGSNSDNPEQTINNLQPHPNLRELEIEEYKGHRSPVWMRDSPHLQLSLLKLSNCPLLEGLPYLAQMPHLKELSLLGMSEVKEVDYSFDSRLNACAFPSLERLMCDKMPNWQSWAGLLSSHGFLNLKFLRIANCPNLGELPAMPLSLCDFSVENVGLNSLPDIYHNSSTSISAPSSPKSSLETVEFNFCPNLKSLNGFLQQEHLDFHAIESLFILNCENLVHLPTSAFGKFVSLKLLEITGCPKLVAVDNQRIILPVKLQTLRIGDCGELDETLLESASQHTTLARLSIINSATITCIPCSENAFASLSTLDISGCDKLIQHSLMAIAQGSNPGNSMPSLKINKVHVPHQSLLFIEPLRSLRFVRTCHVVDCSGMEALPEQWLMQNSSTLENLFIINASSLRSLPDTMVRLTALKQLEIKNAILLEQIPELPPSLSKTVITGTGELLLV